MKEIKEGLASNNSKVIEKFELLVPSSLLMIVCEEAIRGYFAYIDFFNLLTEI